MLSCHTSRDGVQVLRRAFQSASLLPVKLHWAPLEASALDPSPAMAAATQGPLPGATSSAARSTVQAPATSHLPRSYRAGGKPPLSSGSSTLAPHSQPSFLSALHWQHSTGTEAQAHRQEHWTLNAAVSSQPQGNRGRGVRVLAERPVHPDIRHLAERNVFHRDHALQHGGSGCGLHCSLQDGGQPVRSHHFRGASLACSSLAHEDISSGTGTGAETTGDAGVAFSREALSCCEPGKAPLRVAVLLSGGVDSSVALRMLHAAGHRCTAFYLKIWFQEDFRNSWEQCPWEEDLGYAQAVCDEIGVELRVVHLTEEYWGLVVSHCMNEIQSGRTPNPDMLCNSRVKFGAFFSHLDFEQFDRVASGHYARVVELEDTGYTPESAPERHQTFTHRTVALALTKDPVKDQTYFLSHLSQQQLARAMFPLGALSKAEVREWATRLALPNCSRRDSQGICFLGKVKFGEFLAERIGEREGRILEAETGEELGRHRGFWFYTIGQRQGIRLSGGPWYVVAKDTERNVVFVSKTYYSADKNRRSFWVGSFSWLTPGVDWSHHVTHLSNTLGLQVQGISPGAHGGQHPLHLGIGGEGRQGAGGREGPTVGSNENPPGWEGVSGAEAGGASYVPSVDWSSVLVKVRHGPKLYRCSVEFLSSELRSAAGVARNGSVARDAPDNIVESPTEREEPPIGRQKSTIEREESGHVAMLRAQDLRQVSGKVVEAEFLEDLEAWERQPGGGAGTPAYSDASNSALSQSDPLDSSSCGDTLHGMPGTPHEAAGEKAFRGTSGGSSVPRKEALVRIGEDDQGLAAGQYAVFYAGDVCLGGAMILGMPEDGVRSAVSPEALLAAQRSEADWEALYQSRKSKSKAKKEARILNLKEVDMAQRATS